MRRSVQYWKLTNQDGTDMASRFPFRDLVQCLDDAKNKNLNRHRRCRDGMVLLAHPARVDPLPSLVLDKVRHENLPSVGDADGRRRAIGLAEAEGLLEPTYCAFMQNNVVAMLASSDGPRPGRLVDYIHAKFGLAVGLAPVLRRDLEAVLQEMRVTSVDIAIPASRINRDLVGGDWVRALDAARQLSHDGVVRVGFSVGRRGTREQKRQIGESFRERVRQLLASDGLSAFDSAKVTGIVSGTPRTVDLILDKFTEQTEVDTDRWSDPARSVDYANEVLQTEILKNQDFIVSTTPVVTEELLNFSAKFIENPDDEQSQT